MVRPPPGVTRRKEGPMTQKSNFSQLGKMINANRAQFNIQSELASSKLQSGSEFILIERTRQGEDPRVWASGDLEQARQLYDQFTHSLETSETTS